MRAIFRHEDGLISIVRHFNEELRLGDTELRRGDTLAECMLLDLPASTSDSPPSYELRSRFEPNSITQIFRSEYGSDSAVKMPASMLLAILH